VGRMSGLPGMRSPGLPLLWQGYCKESARSGMPGA
jgi:hypothetical protein